MEIIKLDDGYLNGPESHIGKITRLKVRDAFVDGRLIQRVVKEVQFLLEVEEDELLEVDIINLWDEKTPLASFGINYSERY